MKIVERARAARSSSVRDRRAPRRRPRSATPTMYIERYCAAAAPHRDPGRRRQARRRTRTSASASARSSAATRSWSRRRRRSALPDDDAREADRRRRSRAIAAPSATPTSARWSSCSTPSGELLLHGDEHAHPGRAPGDRDGHRRSTWCASRSGSPRASALSFTGDAPAARPRDRAAASTPRIRTRSRRRRARSPRSTCRAASVCVSIRTSTTGYVVPPNYDSLLAKLIVHADDRDAPRSAALRRCLDEIVVEGIRDQHRRSRRRIVDHPDFIGGELRHRLRRALAERASRQPREAVRRALDRVTSRNYRKLFVTLTLGPSERICRDHAAC